MTINPLDIFILLVMLIFVLRSTIRGFVQEFASVAALLLGILVAVLFNGLVGSLLEQYIGVSMWNRIIAFLALFIVVYLIVKLSEAGLKNLIENARLENLDRALGFFLGLIEGALVSFVIMFVLYIQPFVSVDGLFEESWSGKLLSPLFPYAARILGPGEG